MTKVIQMIVANFSCIISDDVCFEENEYVLAAIAYILQGKLVGISY